MGPSQDSAFTTFHGRADTRSNVLQRRTRIDQPRAAKQVEQGSSTATKSPFSGTSSMMPLDRPVSATSE
jgi:hypothetical protein